MPVSASTDAPSSPRAAPLARFGPAPRAFDDQAVRGFLLCSAAWSVAAGALALLTTLLLVFPGLGRGVEVLSYGRLRPVAMHVALWGFAANAIFAGAYFAVQRLCLVRLWSRRLAWFHLLAWQIVLAAALLTLPAGLARARPFHEAPAPVVLAMLLLWLVFGTNILLTIRRRRRDALDPALWFLLAGIAAIALAMAVSLAGVRGLRDFLLQGWVGQTTLGFVAGALFVGVVYAVVPAASAKPLYSRKLAILHFWTLLLALPFAAAREAQWTSAPEWVGSLGLAAGVLLWAPGVAGAINGLQTLRRSPRAAQDPAFRFLIASLLLLALLSLLEAVASLKRVSAVTAMTEWSLANREAWLFGWCGLVTFALAHHVMPRIFASRSPSRRATEVHFWLIICGLALWIGPTWLAGWTRGRMWLATTPAGALSYPDFVVTLDAVRPHYWLRGTGQALYLSGLLVGTAVLWRAWRSGVATPAAIPGTATNDLAPRRPESRWEHEHSVADLAKRLDVLGSLWWHRRWERRPTLFLLAPTGLLAAALLVLATTNPPTGDVAEIAVRPLSPLELAGRAIYLGEGCNQCHTQQVRPILAETQRHGPYSRAAESMYASPPLFGQTRIGPDLARQGGRNSHFWHLLHFQDPRRVTPGSVMPAYTHLLYRPLQINRALEEVRTLAEAGVPYDPMIRANPEADAGAQARKIADEIVQQGGPPGMHDREVAALIAYLQRLGTDMPAEPSTTQPTDAGEAP